MHLYAYEHTITHTYICGGYVIKECLSGKVFAICALMRKKRDPEVITRYRKYGFVVSGLRKIQNLPS